MKSLLYNSFCAKLANIRTINKPQLTYVSVTRMSRAQLDACSKIDMSVITFMRVFCKLLDRIYPSVDICTAGFSIGIGSG